MEFNQLTAISPIDGRYFKKADGLRVLFSELGLQKARVEIEIKWLMHLAQQEEINELENFNEKQRQELHSIYKYFSIEDAKHIKELEKTTNHDVKAIEYFIAEKLQQSAGYEKYFSFIHFACTSEDINNLAYSLLLIKSRKEILVPHLKKIHDKLANLGLEYKSSVMLARTHGQAATPTTMGKELINFAARLQHNLKMFNDVKVTGKFNGAVGNYNAHVIAYPDVDWPKLCQNFVNQLGVNFNDYSTQINSHDDIAEYVHCLVRLNNILLDLVKDIWGYISLGYFKQKAKSTEVGSSTMPHKINPIDFENAEGNLGIANAILEHLSAKLPLSRLQRDLTDSTVLRNLGVPVAHILISYKSILKGLDKLILNEEIFNRDLENNWAVVAEAVQTILRREGYPKPYEALKDLTRTNTHITKDSMHTFINGLNVSAEVKAELLKITPQNFVGKNPEF